MQTKLSFLGATRGVTGSCTLIEANGSRVLVDCGMYQERKLKVRNWEPFAVPPDTIDAVLLTHAHLDHSGLIPKLVKDGFKGKIYCTDATAELAHIIMLDSGHIQEEDAKYKAKRHKREGRSGPFPDVPLYTVEDARAVAPHFKPIEYEDEIVISDGISARFCDAGHVLGSSMIKVTAGVDGEKRTILFSGDVGRNDKPIINDPHTFKNTDYVVTESTYGDRVHPPTSSIEDNLATIINDTYEAGGNIVVPSFALERTQEMLYFMYKLRKEKRIPPIMVFLDSPMAIKMTEVFRNHPEYYDEEMTELVEQNKSPFDFPGLKMTPATEESKGINFIKGTIMIIAGSGMCTGGRVKHHLAANIERKQSTLMFIGYQAIGTLGRIIVDGKKSVRVMGQQYRVKANVAQIYGFSAHADKDELLTWLTALTNPPKKVFIIHGEEKSAHSFGKYITQKTGWDTLVPEYRQKVILD
ncbi:MAG: MBL fold metallo-hydrolase [Chloroflexi bacterium]|jgi:metallo-beta-lactamase family protein|nr:MBL fold metallo-hydrolase [Chloroflexota bacterium]MBT7081127.1 MBL fold metallo-hydrolase [Chloroflexota bacterium]MBT7289262.1 MBL fold metallo-hydrolase [Chloroflexota bacterium]